MNTQPSVLDVMDRLIASVNDDEIELDARADLSIAGTQARATVAELIGKLREYQEWNPQHCERDADLYDQTETLLTRAGGA